jgi:hypothetical protein
MRHGEAPPALARHVGEGQGVVAARRSLQPVEQHQQRARRASLAILQEVHVHEVAVRRVPALAPVAGRGPEGAAREQRGPDGLRMAAAQPGRRFVIHSCSRFSVKG